MHLAIIISLLLDQITKAIVSNMGGYFRFPLIPGFVWIVKTTNTGIAFGMLSSYTEIITWVSIVVAVFLSVLPFMKEVGKLGRVSLGFIIGGALGNIIDRLRFGRVVDFIVMKYFPAIFNVADIFITVGGVLFILAYLWRERDGSKSYRTGEPLETGQVITRETSILDIKEYDTESDKRWESSCERQGEKTELQSKNRRDDNDRGSQTEENRDPS